jgi:hypothetical protein
MTGANAINPIVAFYDIHGRKREVLFFYFVPDTTRDCITSFKIITFRIYHALRDHGTINLGDFEMNRSLL